MKANCNGKGIRFRICTFPMNNNIITTAVIVSAYFFLKFVAHIIVMCFRVVAKLWNLYRVTTLQ